MTDITISFRDLNVNGVAMKHISFRGQLDETNVDSEAKKIYQIIGEMPIPKLILDFSELEYMNSKSIGYVTDWYTQALAKQGGLAILNPRPNILDILKVVGITQIIPVYGDLESAQKELAAQNSTIAA